MSPTQTGWHVPPPTRDRGPSSGPRTGIWDSGASWWTEACPQHTHADSAEEGRGPQAGDTGNSVGMCRNESDFSKCLLSKSLCKALWNVGTPPWNRASCEGDHREAEKWPTGARHVRRTALRLGARGSWEGFLEKLAFFFFLTEHHNLHT